ncbi:Gfo/Idh/MocA family protein [Polaribacter sargassicola]|uniref:Gfo/Idh/MocA family protein n=1 Tax=Polaribacter sargassicola TaxID=2836891 RepID=UPI001F26C1C4|nr:Gfo/Idh/MocA family oxidoreductase [Polaribacter sp. DS7-9]MCG1037385.1 Gfo/Idh/MocA family oxidoreductase [Polaribacter sp. DS7-9]
MKLIKWGIIGCGDVAEVKSGPAFNKVNNSKLIAVMRRDAKKAEDFAIRHKVSLWYDSVDKLLENKEINAVYIATPPSTHLEIAKKCLLVNKYLYLEKPITLNFSEAKELSDLINKQTKLVVAHYRRKLPAFLKVKELIDSGSIGNILHVDVQILQSKNKNVIVQTDDNWRLKPEISGGGYFHDIAPHQIDLMYYFFGDIKKAEGFSTSLKNNKVADIINGCIEFKNGIQFKGLWNFNVSDKDIKDECKIYGEKGTISFSFYGESVFLSTLEKEETFSFKNPKNIQKPMIESTVNYFLEKEKNPCPIESGLTTMKILDLFTKK